VTDQRMRLAVDVIIENGQFKAEVVNSEQLTKRLGETGKQSFGALGEAASRVDGPIGNFARSIQNVTGMASRMAIALYGGLAAVAAWGAGIVKGSAIAGEHERQLKRLEAQVRATGGAAGKSVEQLEEQSQRLSRITLFDDNEIRRAQGILLTFKSVTGDYFDQTIETAADMAEIMGGDLSGAVMQLGKALEDPEQGLTALTRSGISFNAQQKETIKYLAETGQKGQALDLILRAINSQLGPAATAAADGYAGAMHRVAESWEDFLEALEQTDTMQYWLNAFDTLLQKSRALIAPTEAERAGDLFKERYRLEQQNKLFSDTPDHINVITNNRRIAEIDAELAEMRAERNARLGTASGSSGSAGSGGGGDIGRPTPEYERDVRDQIRAYNEQILESGRKERDANEQLLDQYDQLGAEARQRTEDQIRLQELAAAGDERAILALNNMALGLDNVGEAAEDNSRTMSVFADQAARNMQSAFANFLFDPFEEGVEGMLKSFGLALHRMVVEAAAARLFEALGINSLLSSIGPAPAATAPATVAHTGGVVGGDALPTRDVPAFVFAGAPRYHSGMLSSWLRPNERPAILEQGESVLTAAQMRALGGSASGGGTTVQIINNGTPVQVDRRESLRGVDGRAIERIVISTLERDAASGGPGIRAIQRATGTRRQGRTT
jgi:hypothetical protein